MDISVVVPVLNEEESLPLLHESLTDVLAESDFGYEIIVIDDGSTDRSLQILRELQARDGNLQVVCFRRNYGQTAAFACDT